MTTNQPAADAASQFIAEVVAQPDAPIGQFITSEYLAKRPLSYSSLKAFRRSPLHYVQYLLAPRESTPALKFGGLVDCLVLTPDLYEKRYAVMPKYDMRKTVDKEAFAKFVLENEGKDYVTQDMLDAANDCKAALMTNPISSEYIHNATTTQRKVKWVDKETGLPMTCYMDMDGTDPIDFIGELKTGADMSPDKFMRSAYDFGYHIQAATYLEAARRSMFRFPKFVFICVETEPPYGVAVYDKISPAFFQLGLQELQDLRQAFKHCLDNKLFHQSYDFLTTDGGLLLDLPAYARQKIRD